MTQITLHRRRINSGQISTLLRSIGVPERMLKVKGVHKEFWSRPINFLEILEWVRNTYRHQVKIWHPDKPNGNAEQATLWNMLWQTVEQRFKQHGHELL